MRLSLQTLRDFDFGKAAVAWDKCLDAVVRDCEDRPGDETAREITMKARIIPIAPENGTLDEVYVEFVTSPKLPPYKTAARPLLVGADAQLLFESMSPDNPRQTTIDAVADLDAE